MPGPRNALEMKCGGGAKQSREGKDEKHDSRGLRLSTHEKKNVDLCNIQSSGPIHMAAECSRNENENRIEIGPMMEKQRKKKLGKLKRVNVPSSVAIFTAWRLV